MDSWYEPFISNVEKWPNIKAFKAFIKPFEATQRKVWKQKFKLIFILIPVLEMHGAERINYFCSTTNWSQKHWDQFYFEISGERKKGLSYLSWIYLQRIMYKIHKNTETMENSIDEISRNGKKFNI